MFGLYPRSKAFDIIVLFPFTTSFVRTHALEQAKEYDLDTLFTSRTLPSSDVANRRFTKVAPRVQLALSSARPSNDPPHVAPTKNNCAKQFSNRGQSSIVSQSGTSRTYIND
eukprot:912437-Amphidinium_carterae.1